MTDEAKQPEATPKPKKSSARTWLIFFVVVGILAWWLVPDMMVSYKMYMNKAYHSMTKAELKGLHSACQNYWQKNGADQECSSKIAAAPEYGFQPNPKVSTSGSGTQTTFTATAQHQDSDAVLKMDAEGNIQ